MTMMGWDLDTTIGKLHRFWWWCVDYAEDGDLRRYNDSMLAAAVALDPVKGREFVEAMVTCGGESASGFIERSPYFRVHDWWDYCGMLLQIRYKHSPKKWMKIRSLYDGKRKNSSKNGSYNTTPTEPNQPNQTKPNQQESKEDSAQKPRHVFEKPTAQQVSEYSSSIGKPIDGEAFVAFYESKGWLIGKTPMRSWKAAVVTWTKRQYGGQDVRRPGAGYATPTGGRERIIDN